MPAVAPTCATGQRRLTPVRRIARLIGARATVSATPLIAQNSAMTPRRTMRTGQSSDHHDRARRRRRPRSSAAMSSRRIM